MKPNTCQAPRALIRFSIFFLALIGITLLAFPYASPAFAQQFKIESNVGPYKVYDQSKALIIGMSRYKFWDILETVPSEIDAVKTALQNQGINDISVVWDLKGVELGQTLKKFVVQDVVRDTRMVVYYAGHGWTDGRYSGFIVPADNPLEGDAGFRDNLVSMEDISNWSKLSKAKHMLFVFDSCFSGAVFLTRSNLKPSELFLQDADVPVRQFITSGSATDQVPSRSDFAEKFVLGLNGAADVYADGVVTANELGYWLKKEISALGRQTPQYGSSAVPGFSHGDVLFRSLGAPSVVQTKIPLRPGRDGTRSATIRKIGIPEDPGLSLFRGIDILYFQKVADASSIVNALDAKRIPFMKTRAVLPESMKSNAIVCGRDVPVEAIKELALTLIHGGVQLRAIFAYEKLKPGRMEILSYAGPRRGLMAKGNEGISLEQIASLTSCPK